MWRSVRQTAQARTFRRTCPGPGWGATSSASRRGLPAPVKTIMRTDLAKSRCRSPAVAVARGQRRVAATGEDQVLVRARLDHASVVEHDDLIGVADGRKPVRDRNRRPPLGK